MKKTTALKGCIGLVGAFCMIASLSHLAWLLLNPVYADWLTTFGSSKFQYLSTAPLNADSVPQIEPAQLYQENVWTIYAVLSAGLAASPYLFSRWPRTSATALLGVSETLLGLFFIWSAHFDDNPTPLGYYISWFGSRMSNLMPNFVGQQTLFAVDYECALLLLGCCALVFYLSRSPLNVLQALFANLAMLGLDIYFFGHKYWLVQVTDFQYEHNFAMWFTNEVLASIALTGLTVAIAVELLRRWRPR